MNLSIVICGGTHLIIRMPAYTITTYNTNTCRVFFGNKRYSTGRTLANNSFLQVYPTMENFLSEAEWRTVWTKKILEEVTKQISFTVETTIARDYTEIPRTLGPNVISVSASTSSPPTPAPNPTPVLPANTVINQTRWQHNIVNLIKGPSEDKRESTDTNTKTPVQAPAPPKPTVAEWYCSYCEKEPGKDHRMCVCKAQYNSKLWEANRTFPEYRELTNKASVSDSWTFKEKLRNVELPAGEYYIGDLCYALQDQIYDKVFGKEGYESGFYQSPNGSFLVNSTAYGDGEYPGSDKHSYCVDAGIIGIASMGVCDKNNMDHKGGISGGHIYTFDYPVTCSFKGGNFHFSTRNFAFTINTVGYDDDEY